MTIGQKNTLKNETNLLIGILADRADSENPNTEQMFLCQARLGLDAIS